MSIADRFSRVKSTMFTLWRRPEIDAAASASTGSRHDVLARLSSAKSWLMPR